MLRDIFPNKEILGAMVLLIIFAGGCYLWYQHTLAADRKAAAETAEFARQWEKQKAKQKAVKAKTTQSTAESNTLTATKERASVIPVPKDIEATHGQTGTFAENRETAEGRVSPYGFGTYPDVPKDYPIDVIWKRPESKKHLPDHALKGIELLDRVLVKLWGEGDKNFRGGVTDKGKVYPYYHNTVYVRYGQQEMPDGTIRRYLIKALSAPYVDYDEKDLLSDIPPVHLHILDLDSTGIDPYQFLNLP